MATFALSPEYLLHGHQLEAFYRTITANELRKRYSPPMQRLPSLSQIEELFKILLKSLPVSDDDHLKNPCLINLLALIVGLCKNRSSFLTQEGKFSFDPHKTRPDNFVLDAVAH
jgi:hypothetical protein